MRLRGWAAKAIQEIKPESEEDRLQNSLPARYGSKLLQATQPPNQFGTNQPNQRADKDADTDTEATTLSRGALEKHSR